MSFLVKRTVLEVTKFPNARVLKVSFKQQVYQELQTFPWLRQLVALPQLTRVALSWADIRPARFLLQLPAGCELEIDTWGKETLSEALPHPASLAHLVDLKVRACKPVDFSCLAACPNLRHVMVHVHCWCTDIFLEGVDWSTLNLCHTSARLYWTSEMLPCVSVHSIFLLAGPLCLAALLGPKKS